MPVSKHRRRHKTGTRDRIHTNPIGLAKHKAGRLTHQELARLRESYEPHFVALREGRCTLRDFAGISTACELALAIESKGVVRGLESVMTEAQTLLLDIKRRHHHGGAWTPPVLRGPELTLLQEMLKLHMFQLAQLSYGEYQAAWRLMIGRVTSEGGQVIGWEDL